MQIDPQVANHGAQLNGNGTLTSATGSPVTLDAVRGWSTAQVVDWLERNRMGQYTTSFVEHEIVGDTLLELTRDHLKDLQVLSVGDRVRLHTLLHALRKSVLGLNLVPSPSTAPSTPHRVAIPTKSASKSSLPDRKPDTLDMKRAKSEGTGLGALGGGSQLSPDSAATAALKRSESIMNMDFVKQNCIKVTGEKNETRIVNVNDLTDAKAVLARILTKFNLAEDTAKFCLFVAEADSTRVLSDTEVVDICRDPTRPEREKLFLRKRHTPFTFANKDRGGGEQPTIRQKLARLDEFVADPALLKTTSKLNKFFGARPPSELITKNLNEFFPTEVVAQVERRRSRAASLRASKLPALENDDDGSAQPGGGYASSIASDLHPSEPGSPPSANAARSPPMAARSPQMGHHRPRPAPLNLASPTRTNGGSPVSPRPRTPRSPDPGASPVTSPRMTAAGRRDASPSVKDQRRHVTIHEPTSPSAASSDANNETPLSPLSPVEPDGIAPTSWIKGSLIGQGSFGSVYLGLNANTGGLMAVKQVELPSDGAGSEAQERKIMMVQALDHEISFLKDLHHKHIVQYLGSTVDDKYFNIFLEYIPGGSIYANLQTWGAFPEPMIKSYLRQTLLGLAYLHERGILHRDIKAANLLVDNHGIVKISDFGISKRIEREEVPAAAIAQGTASAGPTASMGLSLQGSVYWMAPEVVKHMKYTTKSDIWAVGCLVVEMFTATHPWAGAAQVEAIYKIAHNNRPEIPDNASEDAKDLLRKTFALDYHERPSAQKLLEHPFVLVQGSSSSANLGALQQEANTGVGTGSGAAPT
ncbi:ATP binding [Allomyces arbusculus]|nr:ATP binding [Allomyces arbusculus]